MLTDRDFFMITVQEGQLDYKNIFGNDNPVYIEIGSGKGEFISQYPLLNPKSNFIGFEVRDKRIRNILKKIDPIKQTNVRLMSLLVDEKIKDVLPEESVEGVFIQHPDPWPKKKHHKRRLIQQAFLDALAGILKIGAFVQVSTDHEEYAAWIAEEFIRNHNFDTVSENVIQDKPHFEQHVITWFEHEQRRLGFEPRYMLFKRI